MTHRNWKTFAAESVIILVIISSPALPADRPFLDRANIDRATGGTTTVKPARPAASRPPRAENPSPESPRQLSLRELAQNKADEKNHVKTPVGSPWTTVSALAVVIGLILIVARLFRRHAPLINQGLPAEALEVLGRRFIDQRQAVFLIRLGSRILVVGSSANGLHSLGEITDPVEVDILAGLCRRDADGAGIGNTFRRLFQRQVHAESMHAEIGPTEMTRPTSTRRAATAGQGPVTDREPVAEPAAFNSTIAAADRATTSGLAPPEYELMRRLRGDSSRSRGPAREGQGAHE